MYILDMITAEKKSLPDHKASIIYCYFAGDFKVYAWYGSRLTNPAVYVSAVKKSVC